MVENFTQSENEVQNLLTQNEKVMTDEDIENELKLQLPKMLLHPSKRSVENILAYSKQLEKRKA
ncbi:MULTISPECIES: hypothetical protein [Sphingobacterium]|jgi:hypothetical protein|uniref:Uncharacterized protein n=1 Tax=Sphingobacterium multivorum TaxID=28454 RepID=A0A2X2IYK9_SPHMU|nr:MULTISPECIES: hypothetical protein [Sphingobacterium]MCS4167369.1 hypothetical protein [Sphingobacterium sp. BIGb0116]MDF2853167.1 hypothetical protein [Sphingobacterium multivorum]QRQ61541.1 hypothetical protein I6J33_00600 [Sphingobacterium multivorum]SPZ84373.1 Uncharacterised protein [Sphingobacterium multivorum]